MASDLSPKMAAFLEVMRRSPHSVWGEVEVACKAGYSLTIGRNGASPARTFHGLQRLGLVETFGSGWKLKEAQHGE